MHWGGSKSKRKRCTESLQVFQFSGFWSRCHRKAAVAFSGLQTRHSPQRSPGVAEAPDPQQPHPHARTLWQTQAAQACSDAGSSGFVLFFASRNHRNKPHWKAELMRMCEIWSCSPYCRNGNFHNSWSAFILVTNVVICEVVHLTNMFKEGSVVLW